MQHAHQKGIIHRDLKPSNILVERHDDKPVPKVIDFGLAKATAGSSSPSTALFTRLRRVAGTPLYMAPEQARSTPIDVDTRADVYALGVILYELLTGSTPIARETFRRAALDEMLRVIREVEPPTPSSRISTPSALPSLAASRQIEPARLGRFVRGDLDWIVMKALAKERHRRYDSAIGLALDIERFLNHEPVSAGPPTAAVSTPEVRPPQPAAGRRRGAGAARAGRRHRRHDAGAHRGATSEAERRRLGDCGGGGPTGRGRTEATGREAPLPGREGQRDPRFGLPGHRPEAGREGRQASGGSLGERLDVAMAQIEGDAIGDPLVVARMQRNLAESQLGLGYPAKAIELFTKARAALTKPSSGPMTPRRLPP